MTDTRTTTLENALKALGINPDNDPMHHAERWISGRDDDRRERDRAIDDARIATARIKDLEAKIASNVADLAARDMRIADLERDLSAKFASLKRICEVIGAPTHVSPDVIATLTQNALNKVKMQVAGLELERAWAREAAEVITSALDDAGAPTLYTGTTDPNGIPIPDPERIRLLGERARGEHAERIREGDNVQVYRDRLAAAERALDDRDAPRFADGAPLSPAARIRALPR